jgi:predicted aspartyl protease
LIYGYVTAGRQAIIPVRLKGSHGSELTVDAMLDTGFAGFLSLPDILIEQLGLQAGDSTVITLADGMPKLAREYQGAVYWDNQWRSTPVMGEGDATLILVGMGLLFNHYVTMELVDGGTVSAELIE